LNRVERSGKIFQNKTQNQFTSLVTPRSW
jgi:hypothetical protein